MEQIATKYSNVHKAFLVLEKALADYQQIENLPPTTVLGTLDHDDLMDLGQRSLIQAFECFIDVTWKYIKWLLERSAQIQPDFINPRAIITQAVNLRFLEEEEGSLLIELIKCRNMTSHIYKQELAGMVTQQIILHMKTLTIIALKIKR